MSNKNARFKNGVVIQQGTIYRDSQLNHYFNELRKYKTLNKDEEFDLFRKYNETKCPKIKNRIVCANLRFVVSVAKIMDIKNSTVSISDLIQYGNLGLTEAVDLFDYTRGFRFISFAVHHIRKEIFKHIGLSCRIHIPSHITGIERRINTIIEQQLQLHNWELTEAEAFDLLSNNEDLRVSSDYFLIGLHNCSGNASLDTDLSNYDDLELSELVKGDMNIDSNLDTNVVVLNKLLSRLSDDHAEIVRMFYGVGYDFPIRIEDIGVKFNLTAERIRQIIEKSLNKIRKIANIDELELV